MIQQPNGEMSRALCFGHPPDIDQLACAALVSPVRLSEHHLGVRFGDRYDTLTGRIPTFVGGGIDPLVFEALLGDDGWIARFARNDRGARVFCRNSDLASAVPGDRCDGVRAIWERGAVVLVPYGHPSIPR